LAKLIVWEWRRNLCLECLVNLLFWSTSGPRLTFILLNFFKLLKFAYEMYFLVHFTLN
jgi:hypothetical protein